MKTQSIIGLAAVVCVGLGFVASIHGRRGLADLKHADAAYRDGVYQARMDVASGRRPHFSSGRWFSDQDRGTYIAGYDRTYKELIEARSGKTAEPIAVELGAYHDGLADGARHRLAAQPFQLAKTENYRRAGGYAEDANLAIYREAYSNGYQEGYYLPEESAELRTISQK
ncbi:MAG TPA: hypothetical protein VK466_07500 [Terriglobales bacterium]|nr:hypothetical protein [Terriglobales bacterium]